MNPLKVFIIYAHEDVGSRKELEKYLSHLQDSGKFSIWSDKEILPGEVWDASIQLNLGEADIILLLVSVDFYNSNYIQDVAFKMAKARLDRGEAILVPILVRACPWQSYELIKDLQVLPADEVAIEQKVSQSVTYTEIANTLENLANKLIFSRLEAQKKQMEADRAAAELKAKQEAQKAEDARRAKVEVENILKQQQIMIVDAHTEKDKALKGKEIAESQGERLRELSRKLQNQRNIGRWLLVVLFVFAIVLGCLAYYSNKKRQEEKNRRIEVTSKSGEIWSSFQSKVDSIRGLEDELRLRNFELLDIKKKIVQGAIRKYEESQQKFPNKNESIHMESAKSYLSALGFQCKDERDFLDQALNDLSLLIESK